MSNRIMTLHPAGKEGVYICAEKYKMIRDSILGTLSHQEKPVLFQELIHSVRNDLGDSFKGSISWYVTTIKLDLEARDLIHCARGRGPQKITLVGGAN